jgi:hypothetical protein
MYPLCNSTEKFLLASNLKKIHFMFIQFWFFFCLYSINDKDNMIKNKLLIDTKQKVYISTYRDNKTNILNVTSP